MTFNHPLRTSRIHRRDVVYVGTAGFLGMSLMNLLQHRAFAADASPSKAKNVIMFFLTGGPATIDMWDMKPTAKTNIRGEFKPIDTSVGGIQICEYLPRLARQMHHVTLVRSISHSIPEHNQGQAYVMTGNRPTPAFAYPSLGSLSASLLTSNRGVPTNMSTGSPPASDAGELGASFNPFEFSVANRRSDTAPTNGIGLPVGFTVTDLNRRQQVLERIEQRMRSLEESPLSQQLGLFQTDALEILKSDKINQALNIDSESDVSRKQYGGTFLGRSALAARRLIEAGARFITIGFSDWDTHVNHFAQLQASLIPQLDRALGSLLEDLERRGLLEETIVYCTGEFGRTPEVNSNAGRDHWSRSMTALLAGGGFRKGYVYGATDRDGSDPIEQQCSPDDLSATIFRQLGFPPTHTVNTQSGRPVPLFRHGQVLEGLLS